LNLATRAARAAGLRSGVTTQFVAGAAGEPHRELLRASWRLYQELGLRRVYYSGFRPVEGSPLQDVPALPDLHQHRLYQADWLLRFYGFSFDELVFDAEGNLPERQDPKLAWAAAHPDFFPVDLASASYEELLRVPGIGPITARRLMEARSDDQLSDWQSVRRLGVRLGKTGPFVTLRGRLPGDQLTLPLAAEATA
ncbi:MAG: hypothetical protein J7M26_08685, partial [Armatimonadetes bacterium]|nr:hypothetical protein [Armatimonadota bacterium]